MPLFDDVLHSPGNEIPNVSQEIQNQISHMRSLDARLVAALAVATAAGGADFAKRHPLWWPRTAPRSPCRSTPASTSRCSGHGSPPSSAIGGTTLPSAQRLIEGILAHPKAEKVDPTRAQILREALEHAPGRGKATSGTPAPPNGGTTEPVPAAAHRKVSASSRKSLGSAHRSQKGDTLPI